MKDELDPGLHTHSEIAVAASERCGRQITTDKVRKKAKRLGVEPVGLTRQLGQRPLPGYDDEQREGLIKAFENDTPNGPSERSRTKRQSDKPESRMSTIEFSIRIQTRSGQDLYEIGMTQDNNTIWAGKTRDAAAALRRFKEIFLTVGAPTTPVDGSGEWVEGE